MTKKYVVTCCFEILHDENNQITIPGFYDAVEELTKTEKEAMAKAPFSLENYKPKNPTDKI